MDLKHPIVSNDLPIGTKVTCPNCGELIAVANHTIPAGSVLEIRYFDFYQKGHKAGQGMICLSCQAKFAGNFIHTSEGWK